MRILILLTFLWTLAGHTKTLDPDIKHAISKAARRYQVARWDLLKIAYVESSLNKKVKTGRNPNGTFDIGVFQINSIHLKTTCKIHNVKTLAGNAMCAAKILSQHKAHMKVDDNWVARYHSVTPRHKRLYAFKLMKAEMYLMFNWYTIGSALYVNKGGY